jgi:hypothetical protein
MKNALRHLGSVVWPAFLGAAAIEALVFALVDPSAVHLESRAGEPWPAIAVYTVAFFAFWALVAGACLLTVVLERPAAEVNDDGDGPAPAPSSGDTLSSSAR